MGVHVFAGCLTNSGLEQYKNIPNITALLMDVTKEDQVKTALDQVRMKTGNEGLWAIINNAGIALLHFFDFLSVEDLDKMMQINYIGTARVIKHALPLLKRNQGSRVINISSAAGYLGTPSFSGYSASKFAVRGFSNVLRAELKPWEIFVCCIEPAFMKTPIFESASVNIKKIYESAPQEIKDSYGSSIIDYMNRAEKDTHLLAEDPQLVVTAIESAVLERTPSFHYLPGNLTKVIRILSKLPEPVLDAIQRFKSPLPKPNFSIFRKSKLT